MPRRARRLSSTGIWSSSAARFPTACSLPDPMGYVQAFNARTGKRVWTFSVIPQSAKDPGAETWENESWRKNGHGNVWAPMTLDEARGLLYLPTSTPSSDYYGGERPGANLFAESLVCLDAATGRMKWHFQMVHHGLWDYDNPAAAKPGDDYRERAANRRRGAGHQAGFHVRVRSRDGRAGLADRRAAGADRQRRARREAVSDAAVSLEAAGVRRSGRLARGCERSDAGDQGDGAGTDAEVPHRPALHAALAQGDAAAARTGWRRELGRRGIRSRDRLSLRARHAQASVSTASGRTTDRIRSSPFRIPIDSQAGAKMPASTAFHSRRRRMRS